MYFGVELSIAALLPTLRRSAPPYAYPTHETAHVHYMCMYKRIHTQRKKHLLTVADVHVWVPVWSLRYVSVCLSVWSSACVSVCMHVFLLFKHALLRAYKPTERPMTSPSE